MQTSIKKLILLLILTLIIPGSWRNTQGSDSTILSYSHLTEFKFDTLIVAKVGELEITAKEFLLSYEYGPAFVKRAKDSRKRFLEFMIYEKLLALDGYSREADKSQIISETLSEIEGDLATEELYKEEIYTQVQVSEREIIAGVERSKLHISLQWLYVLTFEEVSELQAQLRAGVSFDTLFSRQLGDSLMQDDRFLETTRFKLQLRNPALSAVVDTLGFRRNSSSIGTSDGWYIVRIVNSWRDVIITESEFAKVRNSVSRALFKRQADILSDQYVRQKMLESEPVIKRRTFDILRAYIGKSLFPPEQFAGWELTKKLMAESGPIDSVKISDHLDKTLVALAGTSISLREFVTWYRNRKTVIRFNTTSRQGFFVSLEQFIWRKVRDKLLVAEAMRRNLQHRDIVKTQKKWWRDKSVSALTKLRLAQQIHLDESRNKQYYQLHRKDYLDNNGKPLSWEKIAAEVKRDAFNYERKKVMLHRILALKRKYPIEINQDVLSSLPIELENQPTAIEIYTAKKGGTFPRPAYPTIDFEWIAWY